MTLRGGGRSKLNANTHKELVEKSEHVTFAWKGKWYWLADEYIQLQKELAATNPPHITGRRVVSDQRSVLPFPKTTNQEYGWLAKKKEFLLDCWGHDTWKIPLEPPED